MKLKTYLNGQWVEVASGSGEAAADNLSSTDLREVSVVGNGTIEIDTSIEYNEAMKVVMLSHTAPFDANLHLVGFAEIEGGTRLTFETVTAVEATALVMAVTSAPSSISEAITASREAVAAAQTLKNEALRAEIAAASVVGIRFYAETLIPASAWSNRKATINVEGILATDNPHIAARLDADGEIGAMQKEAWCLIERAESFDGTIEFQCFGEVPTIDLPIQIECLRPTKSEIIVEEVEY